MNSYVSLNELKEVLKIDAATTTHDARLKRVIESISRKIDSYLGRHFFSVTATRRFAGNDSALLLLSLATPPGDLIAVTSLKEDEDRDGVYEETWAATDYILQPSDYAPTGQADLPTTRPYRAIAIDARTGGTKSYFPSGQERFELVGKWGYSESKKASGSLLNGALTSSATSVTVDDGTDFEVLQTIMVEDEQMYITGIAASVLTVERGVNGTTAAAHADDTAVSIIQYPSDIVAATTIEASRRWQMSLAHFSSQVGVPETGEVRLLGGGLRNETKEQIEDYRLFVIA